MVYGETTGLIHFQRAHEFDDVICHMSSCGVWLQLCIF